MTDHAPLKCRRKGLGGRASCKTTVVVAARGAQWICRSVLDVHTDFEGSLQCGSHKKKVTSESGNTGKEQDTTFMSLQEEFEAVTRQVQSVLGAKGEARGGRGEDARLSFSGADFAERGEAQTVTPPGLLGNVNQVG
jgi:hypothetical protein